MDTAATRPPTYDQLRAYSDRVLDRARECAGDKQLATAYRCERATATDFWRAVGGEATTSSTSAVQLVSSKREALRCVLGALEGEGEGEDPARARTAALARWMRATRGLATTMHAVFVRQADELVGAWRRATDALKRAKSGEAVVAADGLAAAAAAYQPFRGLDAETRARLSFQTTSALVVRATPELDEEMLAAVRGVCALEVGDDLLLHDIESDAPHDAVVAALAIVSQPPDNVGRETSSHTVDLFEQVAVNVALRCSNPRFYAGNRFDHRRPPNSAVLDGRKAVCVEEMAALRWFTLQQKLVAKLCVVAGWLGKPYAALRSKTSPPPTLDIVTTGRAFQRKFGVSRGHGELGRLRSPCPGGVAPSRAVKAPVTRQRAGASTRARRGADGTPAAAPPAAPAAAPAAVALDAGYGVPSAADGQVSAVLEGLAASFAHPLLETPEGGEPAGGPLSSAVDSLLTLRVEDGQARGVSLALASAHARLYGAIMRLELVRLLGLSHEKLVAESVERQVAQQEEEEAQAERAEKRLATAREEVREEAREREATHSWWVNIITEVADTFAWHAPPAAPPAAPAAVPAAAPAPTSVAALKAEVGKLKRKATRTAAQQLETAVEWARQTVQTRTTTPAATLTDLVTFRKDVDVACRAYGLEDTSRTPLPTFAGVDTPTLVLSRLCSRSEGGSLWRALFGVDGQSGACGRPGSGERVERLVELLLEQLRAIVSTRLRVERGERAVVVPAFVVAAFAPAGNEGEESPFSTALGERAVSLQAAVDDRRKNVNSLLSRLEQSMASAVENAWSKVAMSAGKDGEPLTTRYSFLIRVLAVQESTGVRIVRTDHDQQSAEPGDVVLTMLPYRAWAGAADDERKWAALLAVGAMCLQEAAAAARSSGARASFNTFASCGGSPVLLHDDGTWSKNGECFVRFERNLKDVVARLRDLLGHRPDRTVDEVCAADRATVAARVVAHARWCGAGLIEEVVPGVTTTVKRVCSTTNSTPRCMSLRVPPAVRRMTRNRVSVVPMGVVEAGEG
jgi:hypothetical protein